MKIFSTEIKAICPIRKTMKTWVGPNIEAETIELADKFCQENGLGYCEVIGELVAMKKEDGIQIDLDSLN